MTFAATRTLLVLLTTLGLGRRARVRVLFRGLAVTVPSCIVGTAVGWAAAAGYAEASLRPLVLAGLALAATWAVHRMHARHSTTLRRHDTSMNYLRDNVTRALVRVMEERDPATQDQLRRVHRLCVGIGRSFDMSESELKTLESAALLHDIGKVSVPESILSKPGKLTPDEMERVKRHAITGSEIVQALPFRHSLAPLIRHHHERWDGDGYPDGLRGEQIPLGARILSAVDCYDALTSDRPYRKALTHREAATFLERETGQMYSSR